MIATAFTSFLAAAVEFVEAATVVLAVGAVRGWLGAITGSLSAILFLAVLVAFFAPLLTSLPLVALRAVIGALLLLFGLRWLRKSILRAAGRLASRDEDHAYARRTTALRAEAGARRRLDLLAVSTSFQIVSLEGLEVVFIVIALGTGGRNLPAAAGGAALALAAVTLAAAWLRRPLSNVPENTIKFAVGIITVAFGTFWLGEGMRVTWPGADWSLAGLLALFLATALFCVRSLSAYGQTA